MEFVMPILEGAWRYVLTLRISDYLDIALMAYAIYWLLKLVGTSKVESVGKVILLFLLALMLSDAFSLNGIYFLLSHILSLGALALIVLFQPEIRRLIDQLGSSRWRSFNPFARTQQVSAIENAIAQTVLACTEMSKTRTGVLIVFEREMALDDIARTGTIVDARVSSELLKNIFFVKAAMHDGAVIMRDGRLLAGGCMLPLSKNVNLSRDLGMRHRAGIGMSENSDAVVVIVSEESGAISVAQPERGTRTMKSKRRKIFYVALSILIAATIWFYVNNKESVTVYVHDVPIEFLNEDTSLADKGLMRISGDEDITVDLKLQMPRNVVYDFDTSELRLVSDLSTITYAGKQSVSYTILYPSKVSSSSVKVESPTIRTVQVEIGELNKKDIEIRCKVVGNVAEGYIAGTVEMLPETLEVRGQQADIMQISYAQVTLDIENASSTVVKLLDYELYDFNDQLIESKNIHPMSENVQVTMPVLKVKDVPLTVNFIESAGSRLENYTYTLSHSSITLSGDATQMAGISEISLGTLALEDVQGSETLT